MTGTSLEMRFRERLTRVTDPLTCSRNNALGWLGYFLSDVGLAVLDRSPVLSRREANRQCATVFRIGRAAGISQATGRPLELPSVTEERARHLHVV